MFRADFAGRTPAESVRQMIGLADL
jgi:hypothetical protein